MDRRQRIAVVTVHGTGDSAASEDGEKWWQRGSAFAARLQERLADLGVDAAITPHVWSGANSATERETAAQALTKRIKRLAKTHDGVHVVGHSHGGNVANDAACMLGWSKRRRRGLASLATVGAPFFRTHVTRAERLGAWSFFLVVAISVIAALAMLGGVMLLLQTLFSFAVFSEMEDAGPDAPPPEPMVVDWGDVFSIVFEESGPIGPAAVLSAVAMLVVLPLAWRGVKRIRRAARKPRPDMKILTIWHPNDEAIAFLQRVERLVLEPFPRGSFLRGSRTGAVLWGARLALLAPAIGLVLFVVGSALEFFSIFLWVDSVGYLGFFTLAVGLAVAPLVFALTDLGYRLIFGVLLDTLARGAVNGVVADALKGYALGRDGDNRVCDTAPTSHYFGAETAVLDGDLAARMSAASAEAARSLFDKHRGGLFSVDAADADAVDALACDTLTWDSLIHTTYFDHPEIADMIADHIAKEAGENRR